MPAGSLSNLRIAKHEDLKETTEKKVQKINFRKGLNAYMCIIIVLAIAYIGYHGLASLKEIKLQEANERREGLNCLLQYKNSDCNPLKQTNECNTLLRCIEEIVEDPDQMEFTFDFISRTSRSMSQTLLGPLILSITILAVYYLRQILN